MDTIFSPKAGKIAETSSQPPRISSVATVSKM